jgi:hypothetical protein
VTDAGGQRLRILFSIYRPGTLRQYASLVALLAERGHEVRLAFPRPPVNHECEVVESVVGASPRVSSHISPRRDPHDGWGSVAWLVRALGDLARFSHPRYDGAPALRRRMAKLVGRRLREPDSFEPVGRLLAERLVRRLRTTSDAALSERVVRLAARLEDAIPTSPGIDAFVRDHAPDVVLATPLVKYASTQVEILKSARAAGVPTGICVASWDNLTNKGLLKFRPDRVFVWNEIQRREAVELHAIPTDRVVVTGAQLFDEWFERRPSGTREDFLRRAGLEPGEPCVLFLGSSSFIGGVAEPEFVAAWIEALRSSGDEVLQRAGIMVRPHPSMASLWADVDLSRFGNAVLWPPTSVKPVGDDARATFFDSLAHSSAVVGINTTAMIEAAIVGKPVLTVLGPEFEQETTLHFHYLLEESGGFLSPSSSLAEHLEQLARTLREPGAGQEGRQAFVASFVRPHGLDRPATPIFADEVEKLAVLPARAVRAPRLTPAQLLLGLEAALCRVHTSRSGWIGSARRLRRRIVARARRDGLVPRREHLP